MLTTEHTLLHMFLNTWRQISFPGSLHDAAFQNFYTFECGTINDPGGLQLPARLGNYQDTSTYLELLTGRIQFESFDRSV